MKRTDLQNKAIHRYCELLAEALNEAGFSFNDQKVIQVEVQFTMENTKESIWRNVQTALYPDKHSTTELDTREVSEVYENINRFIGERAGVHVPFPSKEELFAEQMGRKK